MKLRSTMYVVILVALLVVPSPGDGGASRTFTGEYTSDKLGDKGSLEAVFEPTGDGSWDVVFLVLLDERLRRFAGTASGSLCDGELTGRVQDEDRLHIFTFRGEFEDSRFHGTHAESSGGREVPSGTLTLVDQHV